jgi:hypothetical protein
MPGYAFGYGDIMSHMGPPLFYEPLTSVKDRQQKIVNLLQALLLLLFSEPDLMNQWIGLMQVWP